MYVCMYIYIHNLCTYMFHRLLLQAPLLWSSLNSLVGSLQNIQDKCTNQNTPHSSL